MTANVTTPWGLIPKDSYDQLMLFRAPIAIEVPNPSDYVRPAYGHSIIGW